MTTKLYPYQREGVQTIQDHDGRALLADDMGLGKTIQALKWAKFYLDDWPMVVVCPASLKWNWQNEARAHVGIKAEILEGTKPPKVVPRVRSKIYVLNYDILGYWLPWLKQLNPGLVVLDEAQYVTNRKAKRTRFTKQLTKKVPHLIAISGTPLTNRPAELFPVLNMLWPDVFNSFFSFAMEYCAPNKAPWGWEFKGATKLPQLHRELKQCGMVRRLKKDVLDQLPDKTRVVIPVNVPNRKEYDTAVKDFVTWLRKMNWKKAQSAIRAEKLVKMGYLKRLVGELKLKVVEEWIDNFLKETDGKLIVFGVHKVVVKGLYKRYEKEAVLVNGEVTGVKRQHAIDRFANDKCCRLFFGNIQAAGTGWNGTVANSVLFAELGWTPGEHTQAEDRIHRIGQKSGATIYYLVGKDTIEADLCKIIQTKQKVLDAVLDGRKVNEGLDVYDQLERSLLEGSRAKAKK